MHEEFRVGIDYLEEVTRLCQRVRAAHPTAGVFEAADFQWWWRSPRSTDVHPQLFWIDDAGQPEAATILIDWGDSIALCLIVLPGADPDWVGQVAARGLDHAERAGYDSFEIVVDPADQTLSGVLEGHGLTVVRDELIDAWLAADARPPISALDPSYRLTSRKENSSVPHHMTSRGGPEVEERLNQTSLYRPDLDLVVLAGDDSPAAYGLFWFDPVTATGLVEPMRTEEDHQRRGLARHILTAGLNALFDSGASRVKIAWEPDNVASSTLYTSVGFQRERQCVVMSRPGQ